jgi:carboxymethylenebutenolidase
MEATVVKNTAERAEQTVSLPHGESMPTLVSYPDQETGRGVLVVHDASGRIPFYEDLIARLAAAGYVAALPDLYFRQGPLAAPGPDAEMGRLAQLDKSQSVRDLLAAADWLEADPAVTGTRLGVVGFSLGATLALDMTAERRDLAVAAYYPFPAGQVPADENSPPAPLSLAASMSGPIIAFWGDHDEVVDMADAERLGVDLAAHGVGFSAVIYPGAGHSFMRAAALGPAPDAKAAALDAWARMLDFLDRELSAPVP